jgi:hypothetical protein
MVRGSVAQTVDSKLTVRAPGFRSSASPLLGATPRAHLIYEFTIFVVLDFE